MKEETEHGGVRGDNFGPKGGAVKLDKVFMGEEKIREKKSFAFTRAGGRMEVGKEMGVGRTGEPLTDGEKGGVNGNTRGGMVKSLDTCKTRKQTNKNTTSKPKTKKPNSKAYICSAYMCSGKLVPGKKYSQMATLFQRVPESLPLYQQAHW